MFYLQGVFQMFPGRQKSADFQGGFQYNYFSFRLNEAKFQRPL